MQTPTINEKSGPHAMAVAAFIMSSIALLLIFTQLAVIGYYVTRNPDNVSQVPETPKHQMTLASEWNYRVERCIKLLDTYNGVDVLGHHERINRHGQDNNWLQTCSLHVGAYMVGQYPHLSDRATRIAFAALEGLLATPESTE